MGTADASRRSLVWDRLFGFFSLYRHLIERMCVRASVSRPSLPLLGAAGPASPPSLEWRMRVAFPNLYIHAKDLESRIFVGK